jgi:DNA-binding transcriptional ArsR family regulator
LYVSAASNLPPQGWPPSLNAKDLTAAKALLSDPEITVEEVARRLKVSPATLYRHLPAGRGAGGGMTAFF